MQRAIHLSIAMFLLVCTPAYLGAQNETTLTTGEVTKIEDLIRAEMSQNKIPGLSIAVVRDNQLRYAKGFGSADLENPTLANRLTVYRLGSLSKTITATAVLQLAEKGKLDLDAPIQKYCPAFPVKAWQVTARHLLAHLGGVRDYSNQKFLEEYFSTRHYDSVVEGLDIFKNDPLLQEPGAKFSYSSYGYNLLGCAVEGASGNRYQDYIQQSILKPAKMGQTGVDDAFQIIANRARGYGKTRDGAMRNTLLANTSNKIPSGGLLSTVEDMSKFFLALQDGTLASNVTVERMWTSQTTLDGKQTSYGLGWRVSDRTGTKEIYHGGAAAGFSTFLYIRPEKKVAVVLMANLELLGQKDRDDLARKVADIIEGS